MKFSEIDLQPEVLSSLEKLGFEECTPIQEATLKLICDGKDIAGLAQTGTGKTAAFLVPLIDRILKSSVENLERPETAFKKWQKNHFVLVLVPTRELAEQVFENFKKLRGETGLRGVTVYGGVSYDKQKKGLEEGADFVIATPGRLIDLYKEHLVDLRQVQAIVFDEADRMFDMGFKDDMKYILQRVPKERQFLVFSATLNFDVLNVAYQFGSNPVEVNVSKDQAKAENVVDQIFHVGQEEKPSYLLSIIKKHQPRQAIIFSNFKMNVARVAQFLSENGVPAVGISSLLTQAQRTRVMDQFKADNERNILVATDVAARGLDIKGVDLVINFDLPDDPENYVHRIGRTGRASEKGIAFSLVSDRDVDALMRIEEYLKHKLESGWLEDQEIIKDHKAFPERAKEVRSPNGRRSKSDSKGSYKKGSDKPSSRRGGKGKYKSSDSEQVHRDRKRHGRHSEEDSNNKKSKNNRRKDSAKSGKPGGRRSEDKKVSMKRKKSSRPVNRRTKSRSNQKSGGLLGKVSGFFKKLFS